MEKKIVLIDANEEFIRLDSLLKFGGIVPTGGQAKFLIQSGKISVNGEVCTMRSKKMRPGDVAVYENISLEVSAG